MNAVISGPGPIAAAAVVIVGLLLVDLLLFARGREPTFREGVVWSIGWLVLSLLVAPVIVLLGEPDVAIDYTTVYLIERTLSLDNLFVFLLLFSYFGIPGNARPKLLFWGIVLALVMRGLAILGGTALIEEFHFVIYVLAVTLLYLAYRMYKGVGHEQDPEQTAPVRLARRFKPDASPLTLALISIVIADIAFAIDSIPAAFAITTDAFAIWIANAFALLGLRALFVLVEGLVRRFRYLDQTIAVVLGIVGVKLLIEDVVHISPPVSLLIVVLAFATGMTLSVIADRRDPDAERHQQERAAKAAQQGGHAPADASEPSSEKTSA
jgi:tellurite resistance protein TerC